MPTADTRPIAVVGAGPAGIAAAVRIVEAGGHVTLIDEAPRVGGQIWRHRTIDTLPSIARRWIARLDRSRAALSLGTSVLDIRGDGDDFVVSAERSGMPWALRARAIVLANGARERFLPFPGWTLPGVIGVGGAQALLKAGTSFAGKRVVIAGSGPLLLPVAAALSADGAHVVLVAEQAALRSVAAFATSLWRRPDAIAQAIRYRAGFLRTPYRPGTWVQAAHGEGHLREVVVADAQGASRTIACDVLCTGFGLVPNTELASLLGCATSATGVTVDADQGTSRPHVFCAGEPTGIGGMDLAVVEGEIAGLTALGTPAISLHGRRDALRVMAESMERAFAPRAELRSLAQPDTLVCRCEDVPFGAIDRAWSARQAKLYTRAGMGPCQGRVCGAALEFMCGFAPDSVRLPSEPALLGTLTNTDPG